MINEQVVGRAPEICQKVTEFDGLWNASPKTSHVVNHFILSYKNFDAAYKVYKAYTV